MGKSIQSAYIVALFLFLLAPSASAQKPAQLDSLKKEVRLSVRFSSPDSVLIWALNTAFQEVCNDFDAIPKLDTITIREDSVGVALNTDFLRPNWVMKRIADSIWVPMGLILADTVYEIVLIETDAELKQRKKLEPRYYFRHGKLFTHPKYAKDTTAQDFIVAYWAAERHITAADTATVIEPNFLNAVIEYASYVVHRSRSNFVNAAVFRKDYDRRLGR